MGCRLEKCGSRRWSRCYEMVELSGSGVEKIILPARALPWAEDFHSSVSRRGRRTAGSAPELITKCCGSERPPLLRRSGASHPPRLPDRNNKPHPETRHKSAEVLGPAAQRLRVRKPCGRIFPTAPVVADTEGMRHRAGLRATSRLRHKQAFAAETIFVIGPLQDLPSSGYDPSSKLARSALNPAFFDNGQQRK